VGFLQPNSERRRRIGDISTPEVIGLLHPAGTDQAGEDIGDQDQVHIGLKPTKVHDHCFPILQTVDHIGDRFVLVDITLFRYSLELGPGRADAGWMQVGQVGKMRQAARKRDLILIDLFVGGKTGEAFEPAVAKMRYRALQYQVSIVGHVQEGTHIEDVSWCDRLGRDLQIEVRLPISSHAAAKSDQAYLGREQVFQDGIV